MVTSLNHGRGTGGVRLLHKALHGLNAGANDLGGTLMNESITRAAGAVHGEELQPETLDALIKSIGREPGQRTTLYQSPPAERVAASRDVRPLETPVFFTRGSARHRVRESSPEI